MEKFSADLQKHATEIINHEKKEILLVTDEGMKSNNNKQLWHICNTKSHNIDDTDDDSDNNNDSDMIVRNTILESFIAMLQTLILMFMMILIVRNSMV